MTVKKLLVIVKPQLLNRLKTPYNSKRMFAIFTDYSSLQDELSFVIEKSKGNDFDYNIVDTTYKSGTIYIRIEDLSDIIVMVSKHI